VSKKVFSTGLIFIIAFMPAGLMAQALPEGMLESEKRLYKLSIESELNPIAINRIHSWILRLQDSSGTSVHDAQISFDGGMPEHNHGLATAPSIVHQEDGSYLLQGLRFHMMGYWELVLTINHNDVSDTVLLTLDL